MFPPTREVLIMIKMLGKVFLLALVSLFISSSGAFAEPVSMQMAEDVARTHMRANNERERLAALTARKAFDKRSISTPDIIELQDDQTGETLAYVLGLNPEGFIVVSPDTDITPVIAYSFKGNFPLEDFQDNVLLHMVTWDMENRLEAIPIVSDDLKEKNNHLWEEYLSAENMFLGTLVRATTYGPYLTTYWDQNYPYNYYCPTDPFEGKTSVVGCVATAMAQIVNYHQYPSSVTFTGADNYCYNYPGSSFEICNNNAASASMSGITYPASDYWAAKLSRACGVSVEMAYSASSLGSGASTYNVATALKNKFGYTSATAYATSNYWALRYGIPYASDFYSRLQDDIRNVQPAELAIATSEGPWGHAIVCDGYKSTTGEYHLNYGWGANLPPGGTTNWWYTLPAGMYDYDIVKYGVLDIEPPEPIGQAMYVDPDGSCGGNTPCYTTIQSAINAASSGSVIKILAGTYSENLSLNSSNNYELQGGQNSTYSSTTGTSSVNSMTFGSNCGTVTVGGMVVQ